MIRIDLTYNPRALYPPVDPATVAAWRTFEVDNRRASRQYAALPLAFGLATLDSFGVVRKCIHGCGKSTRSADGQCQKCKRKVVGA